MAKENSSANELIPHLIVTPAAEAIDFYVRAFGAKVDFKLVDPDDQRIGHAELSFGASRLYLADEYPDFGAVGPQTIGGSPVKLHLNVKDADDFVAHAIEEGATLVRGVKLEFHGSRIGMVADPFGYSWFIGSKEEDLSATDMQARWDADASS